MLTFISFPSDFATTTLTYMGDIIHDLAPYLMLVLAPLIVVVIIKTLIKIF